MAMLVDVPSRWIAGLSWVKAELEIEEPDRDDILRRLIASATDSIERYVNRQLIKGTAFIHDGSSLPKLDGNGTRDLFLQNSPLVTLTSVALEDEEAIDITDEDVIRVAKWESFSRLRLMRRLWSRGTQNLALTYTGGFQTHPMDTPGEEATLPDVIVAVFLELIGRKWQEWPKKGPHIETVSIGDSSTTISTSNFTAEQKRLLSPFKWIPGML